MPRPRKHSEDDVRDAVAEHADATSGPLLVEFLYNVIVGNKIYNKGDVAEFDEATIAHLIQDGFVRVRH